MAHTCYGGRVDGFNASPFGRENKAVEQCSGLFGFGGSCGRVLALLLPMD